jgi:putative acetyltransferase
MKNLLPQVLPVRHASRAMVRELGLLQKVFVPANLPNSHCHALLEIDCGGLTQNDLSERLRLDKSTTSRTVAALVRRGWIRAQVDRRDQRRRVLALTPRGRSRLALVHHAANAQVQQALETLDPDDRQRVVEGLSLYARALTRARRLAHYSIRRVRRQDNAAVAAIIRRVMTEFGAVGAGYSIDDPEVDDMAGAYAGPRAAYFVVADATGVAGGGGIAPLAAGDAETCELRKMYFLGSARGFGLGQAMLDRCLAFARAAGFTRVYLETLTSMSAARRLYAKNGFTPVEKPLGHTGHFSCDARYVREL